MPAVSVRNLCKSFKASGFEDSSSIVRYLQLFGKKRFGAVKGVSFDVQKGEIFGLLGSNGAGKSVTLSCIATLLLPDSGSIHVLGADAVKEPSKVKKRINVVFGDKLLYSKLSVQENLEFYSRLYGLNGADAKQRIEELLELLGLREHWRKKFEDLSTGFKQRTAIARALINDPELLLLDEPTSGVDVKNVRAIHSLLRELKKTKTIVLTTHYLKEAEELCDRIALMSEGKIVAIGTKEELQKIAGKDSSTLEDIFLELCR